MERIVGVFILAATAMMFGGLAFYLRQTAVERGWFVLKVPYVTYLRTAAGIKPGDKVRLLGRDVGEITVVELMPPSSTLDVYVELFVVDTYAGYVWSDSKVNVRTRTLLGDRFLELTKGDFSGKNGRLHESYHITADRRIVDVYDPVGGGYKPFRREDQRTFFTLAANEPPDVSSQLDEVVKQAKDALPHILALTNSVARVMSNTAEATERLNGLLNDSQPIVKNLATITTQLKNPKGALGDWLIPTNMNVQLSQAIEAANHTLEAANGALTNANAQVTQVATTLDEALENLAQITGNLRAQVDRNTNMVSEVSRLIVDTDRLVQGLKRHWLLRSAFKNDPANRAQPAKSAKPPRPPEGKR
ncbi:MAG: MCE family protein [Verrucomicrobia bacterium]|nr:MCE family protein [Verrucomicrobiota bacterium]MBI3868564.1 MCE family protein [Verrucomicrobiota bacterium]